MTVNDSNFNIVLFVPFVCFLFVICYDWFILNELLQLSGWLFWKKVSFTLNVILKLENVEY